MFGAEGFDDVSRFCWLLYILLVNGWRGGGKKRRIFNVEQGKCELFSILEKSGFVTHLRNLAVFKCLSQSACRQAMKR